MTTLTSKLKSLVGSMKPNLIETMRDTTLTMGAIEYVTLRPAVMVCGIPLYTITYFEVASSHDVEKERSVGQIFFAHQKGANLVITMKGYLFPTPIQLQILSFLEALFYKSRDEITNYLKEGRVNFIPHEGDDIVQLRQEFLKEYGQNPKQEGMNVAYPEVNKKGDSAKWKGNIDPFGEFYKHYTFSIVTETGIYPSMYMKTFTYNTSSEKHGLGVIEFTAIFERYRLPPPIDLHVAVPIGWSSSELDRLKYIQSQLKLPGLSENDKKEFEKEIQRINQELRGQIRAPQSMSMQNAGNLVKAEYWMYGQNQIASPAIGMTQAKKIDELTREDVFINSIWRTSVTIMHALETNGFTACSEAMSVFSDPYLTHLPEKLGIDRNMLFAMVFFNKPQPPVVTLSNPSFTPTTSLTTYTDIKTVKQIKKYFTPQSSFTLDEGRSLCKVPITPEVMFSHKILSVINGNFRVGVYVTCSGMRYNVPLNTYYYIESGNFEVFFIATQDKTRDGKANDRSVTLAIYWKSQASSG